MTGDKRKEGFMGFKLKKMMSFSKKWTWKMVEEERCMRRNEEGEVGNGLWVLVYKVLERV